MSTLQLTGNQVDPTRTKTIRRAYTREYQERWQRVEADALTALEQSGGIAPGNRFEDEAAFAALLLALMQRHVTGNDMWQRPYLRAGYLRGLQMATLDLRQERVTGLMEPEDAIGQFSHAVALGLIIEQAENDLQEIQAVAAQQAQDRIAIAIAAGQPVGKMLDATSDRLRKIGVMRSRALVSALVVGAVADATLNRLADVGVALVSAVVEYQYTTAGDANVCERCLALDAQDNGKGPGVFTLEEARGIIPQHPNCRCRWRALVLGQETPLRTPGILTL